MLAELVTEMMDRQLAKFLDGAPRTSTGEQWMMRELVSHQQHVIDD